MADVGSSLYPVFLAKSDDKAALGHSHQTKNPLDLPNSKNGMGKKGQGLNNKKTYICCCIYHGQNRPLTRDVGWEVIAAAKNKKVSKGQEQSPYH
mgnify:CR=1 FL=1